jgi:hypothetical protein
MLLLVIANLPKEYLILPPYPQPTLSFYSIQPPLPQQGKVLQQHTMADILPLRCRIVALETELRLVKEQLIQSQNGGAYLIGILGHQSQLGSQVRHDQELETVRAQLDDALQCNARLESLLATSRRARSILETREERRANLDLRALKRGGELEGGDDVFAAEERQANTVLRASKRAAAEKWDAGVDIEKHADEPDGVVNVFEAEVDAIIRGDDGEGEDLLEWEDSEKGVRDGWAAMEEKTEDINVAVVQEPAVDGAQIETEDANVSEVQISAVDVAQVSTLVEKKNAEIIPEIGTARSIHIRSYSREDVKSYDIQPPAAPLQHSQWSLPGNRWPAQRPRPYHRPSYPEIPYYNVTHSFHSTDPSLRRTVLITNVPVGMALSDVLNDHLKSDRILAAKFAGTAGMKTIPPIESNAAIIEFLDNGDAQMYVDIYAGQKVFGLMVVAAPTRPLRRARVDSGYY